MAGEEREHSPGKAPTPKESKIAQLQGEQFQKLGLVKGSISAIKRNITTTIKEIEKIKTNVENEAEKRKDLNPDSYFIKSNIYLIKDHLEQT